MSLPAGPLSLILLEQKKMLKNAPYAPSELSRS